MTLSIKTPRCDSRADLADLVNYRDPNSDRHITKGRSRDPKGERLAVDFWSGCNYVGHAGLQQCGLPPELAGDLFAASESFVDGAASALLDCRGRLRTRVIKLGVWNPPTEIQARLRAISSWSTRSLIAAEFGSELFKKVTMKFRGPLLIWAHPDRHRLHFEFIALCYNPNTRRRYEWAKGLRFDGPGATTFTESETQTVEPYAGVNSQIAGAMAVFARERLETYRNQLPVDGQAHYDRQVFLQRIVLEATISPAGLRRRECRDEARHDSAERLAQAWRSAPGTTDIVAKLQQYERSGLIDTRGLPFTAPLFSMNLGPTNTPVKPATPEQSPSAQRVDWLQWWFRWLDRVWLRFPRYLRRKRLGAVDSIVSVDWDEGNLIIKPDIITELRLSGPLTLPDWAANQVNHRKSEEVRLTDNGPSPAEPRVCFS